MKFIEAKLALKREEKLRDLFKEIFDQGQSKANNSNPYHWYGELDNIFIKLFYAIEEETK